MRIRGWAGFTFGAIALRYHFLYDFFDPRMLWGGPVGGLVMLGNISCTVLSVIMSRETTSTLPPSKDQGCWKCTGPGT